MDPIRIAIIGLGYVGLPLAHLFASQYQVIGFDSDPQRIRELQQGIDRTLEFSKEALNKVQVSYHSPGYGFILYGR